eukprot:TRINITY_DN8415_c0_g2_i1.p1 TRINITY_DN8415_c0_g2~~TRINITY_DN8415_c0_g2_i1.p1  ORF type:complete len:221 (-),score=23.85 TRINITY_DN8415_c0_g2_i1:23-685(-)
MANLIVALDQRLRALTAIITLPEQLDGKVEELLQPLRSVARSAPSSRRNSLSAYSPYGDRTSHTLSSGFDSDGTYSRSSLSPNPDASGQFFRQIAASPDRGRSPVNAEPADSRRGRSPSPLLNAAHTVTLTALDRLRLGRQFLKKTKFTDEESFLVAKQFKGYSHNGSIEGQLDMRTFRSCMKMWGLSAGVIFVLFQKFELYENVILQMTLQGQHYIAGL